MTDDLALGGLRVLDLTRLLPGPYLTRLFADLGAEVIKVEDLDSGDAIRALPPFVDGASAPFTALNHGKACVAIDLRKEAGAAVLLALAERCDVLIESFRPGVMERLGVGYDVVAARAPRLVYASVSGYGAQGPLARVPGHDLTYLARAGVLGLTGPAGAPPTIPGVQVADLAGGALAAASGILAALVARARTGRGRHVEVSMTHGVRAFGLMELARRCNGEAEVRGEGLLTGGVPAYGVYETRDGRYMALAAIEPQFFATFCERVGIAELAGHGLARGAEGARVRARLAALFASRTQAEWSALLAGTDACCEPVRTLEEAACDPDLGAMAVSASGVPLAAVPVGLPVRAPTALTSSLGADTDAVLRELAIDPALIARAREVGALAASSASSVHATRTPP